MVRWVASSGHIDDDRVSVQEVEVLQNFVMPRVCLFVLCVLCFVNNSSEALAERVLNV